MMRNLTQFYARCVYRTKMTCVSKRSGRLRLSTPCNRFLLPVGPFGRGGKDSCLMVYGCLLAPHEATNIVTLERETSVTTRRRRTRKNSAARASHKEKVGVGDSTSTKQVPPPTVFSGDAARAVRTGAQSARFRRARARRNPAPRLPRCLFFWTCKDARREPSSGDWAGVTARLSVLSGQSCALGYRAERTARIRRLRVALRRASRRLHLIARRLEPKRARKGPPGPIIRKSSAPRRCACEMGIMSGTITVGRRERRNLTVTGHSA